MLGSTPKRGPKCCLVPSEIMTILIAFQMMGFRTFKNFYCSFVCKYWRKEFPKLPSYNRFLELIKTAMLPLTLFSQFKSGKKTGVYYIDSISLPACNLKRSHRNKVLKQVSDYGKNSVGWFFGMKLHLRD